MAVSVNWGPVSAGVLGIRALLLGVCYFFLAPDFWKLPFQGDSSLSPPLPLQLWRHVYHKLCDIDAADLLSHSQQHLTYSSLLGLNSQEEMHQASNLAILAQVCVHVNIQKNNWDKSLGLATSTIPGEGGDGFPKDVNN